MRPSLIVVALGVSLGLLAAWLANPGPSASGIEWTSSRPIADFELRTTAGPFSNANLYGHWSLVGFGYLYCPDACPTMLAELRALCRGMDRPVQTVFVSVDPGRDALADIDAYLNHFDAGFIGALGDDAAVLAGSLGARFTQPTAGGVIGHSLQYAIVGPGGRLRGLLRPGFDRTATAADLSAVMEPPGTG